MFVVYIDQCCITHIAFKSLVFSQVTVISLFFIPILNITSAERLLVILWKAGPHFYQRVHPEYSFLTSYNQQYYPTTVCLFYSPLLCVQYRTYHQCPQRLCLPCGPRGNVYLTYCTLGMLPSSVSKFMNIRMRLHLTLPIKKRMAY